MPSAKEILAANEQSDLFDLRIEFLAHIVAGHKCSTLMYRLCPDKDGGCGEWSCKRFTDGLCDTCAHRAAYRDDPRPMLKRARKYHKANAKTIRKAKKKFYEKNREAILAKCRARFLKKNKIRP